MGAMIESWRGVTTLARWFRAGVPLVPVAFHGGHQTLSLHSVRARPGTIRVRFGAPISVEGFDESAVRALADKAQAALAALYAELAAEALGTPH